MTIQNIDYQYTGSRFSLKIEELNIQAGKAYLLLGLNGSGKTTLFGVLSGFLPCSEMIVPDRFMSYLHSYGWAGKIRLSVRDFFLQTLLLLNKPISDLDRMLVSTGINNFKDQQMMSLSSGQLQRCLTEVAFLQDAPLLLFDEPMNALDFLNQELFITKTKKALQEGRSIIASSHIDSILDIDFESVLILDGGRLVATEKLENLKIQNLTFKEYYEKTIRSIH